MAYAAALVIALGLVLATADATTIRSSNAKAAFKRSHPCPATGATYGLCGGYVIDHVLPLACGGADAPSNMQWQTVPEAKAKDQWERNGCRRYVKGLYIFWHCPFLHIKVSRGIIVRIAEPPLSTGERMSVNDPKLTSWVR